MEYNMYGSGINLDMYSVIKSNGYSIPTCKQTHIPHDNTERHSFPQLKRGLSFSTRSHTIAHDRTRSHTIRNILLRD